MRAMIRDQSERMLATVQELRDHLQNFPEAQASFDSIRRYWLQSQLFPPDPMVLYQAINVLINAGELELVRRADGQTQYRATHPYSALANAR